jgi:hypothetical protein
VPAVTVAAVLNEVAEPSQVIAAEGCVVMVGTNVFLDTVAAEVVNDEPTQVEVRIQLN